MRKVIIIGEKGRGLILVMNQKRKTGRGNTEREKVTNDKR